MIVTLTGGAVSKKRNGNRYDFCNIGYGRIWKELDMKLHATYGKSTTAYFDTSPPVVMLKLY